MGETRPATILSEHGEGYCRQCRFVVGLDSAGRLQSHRRGASMVDRYGDAQAPRCSGSYRTPARVTPYMSRKSAFRFEPELAVCPKCDRPVPVVSYIMSPDCYSDHAGRRGGACEGSWTPVR